jgi:cell division protein ZapB
MISEFQDLSDKIDRLAEMTAALRRENASLRHANAQLSAENASYAGLLEEAKRRVAGLIAQIPAPAADSTATDDEAQQ